MAQTNGKKELLKFIFENSFVRGTFPLSSGQISDFYLDGKLTTLDPYGSILVAEAFLEKAQACEVDSIGGLTIGADPIVGSVVSLSHQKGCPIRGFIVRKKAKEHGRQRLIEGTIKEKDRVIIIDDVVTTGGSAMDAVKAVEAQGCTVVKVVPLIDRNEGGRECFKDYDYDPIITINEIFELEAATNRNTKADIKTNLVNANQPFSAVI